MKGTPPDPRLVEGVRAVAGAHEAVLELARATGAVAISRFSHPRTPCSPTSASMAARGGSHATRRAQASSRSDTAYLRSAREVLFVNQMRVPSMVQLLPREEYERIKGSGKWTYPNEL